MSKLLSLLLCFAMVFSLLALPAQAAKADASSVDGTYIGTPIQMVKPIYNYRC